MRSLLWLVNVVGGLAVLGSYAHGILTHDEPGRALWGGVPESLRPLYQVSMLLATAGYFAFSGFLLFALPTETTRIAGRLGYGALVPIHALFLLASALWMPLTFRYLAAPTPGGWIAVRLVLFATGLGALLMQTLATTMYYRGVAPAVAPVLQALLIILVALLQSEKLRAWVAGIWRREEPVA